MEMFVIYFSEPNQLREDCTPLYVLTNMNIKNYALFERCVKYDYMKVELQLYRLLISNSDR